MQQPNGPLSYNPVLLFGFIVLGIFTLLERWIHLWFTLNKKNCTHFYELFVVPLTSPPGWYKTLTFPLTSDLVWYKTPTFPKMQIASLNDWKTPLKYIEFPILLSPSTFHTLSNSKFKANSLHFRRGKCLILDERKDECNNRKPRGRSMQFSHIKYYKSIDVLVPRHLKLDLGNDILIVE